METKWVELGCVDKADGSTDDLAVKKHKLGISIPNISSNQIAQTCLVEELPKWRPK